MKMSQILDSDQDQETPVVTFDRWNKPKRIYEQIQGLEERFKGLTSFDQVMASRIDRRERESFLTKNWYAVPNRAKCTRVFGPSYTTAVEKIIDALIWSSSHLSRNYCVNTGDNYLRQTAHARNCLAEIAKMQKNPDILIFPVQFGQKYAGCSIESVRSQLKDNEFGLGILEAGCMLLNHPEMLSDEKDLRIELPGDEYAPGGDCNFSFAPFFQYRYRGIELGETPTKSSLGNYCSATGFLF